MLLIEVSAGCAVYLVYLLAFHRAHVKDILGAFLGRRRG